MRRRVFMVLVAGVLAAGVVPIAEAQSAGDARPLALADVTAMQQPRPAQPARPPVRPGTRPRPRRGFAAFATFDRTTLHASQTFDAVVGTHRFTSWGAGVEATNLVSRVFARVAFSRLSADGERVFIIDGATVPLGIPLEVEMTPIEIAAGWRQPFGRRGRVAAYGGAGLLVLGYRETSAFAGGAENTDERFRGYLVLGGVDVDVFKGLMAGVEVQYRSVADAIGDAGVSSAFGENDLGGVVVRMLFGFRR